jgi:hypothetical protein
MKAAVCEGYGPPEVVQIRDVPKPAPADGEVLIKAAATTVNSGDARVRALRVPRGMSLAVRLRFGLTKATESSPPATSTSAATPSTSRWPSREPSPRSPRR